MRDSAFLTRQPLFDSRADLGGYELSALPRAGDPGDAEARLLGALYDAGGEGLPGTRLLFVGIERAALQGTWVEGLAPERFVLALGVDVAPTPKTLDRVRALRAKGFRFAVDGRGDGVSALAELTDYLKLDPKTASPQALALARPGGARLIAAGVDSALDFGRARRAGFELFQGDFYRRPAGAADAAYASPGPDAGHGGSGVVLTVTLFNQAQRDPGPDWAEGVLLQESAFGEQVLRHLGAACGLARVHSVPQAVALLGRSGLCRFLALGVALARAGGAPGLAKHALTRARLAESLGADRLGIVDGDYLFVAGLFSLLDALWEMSLEDALEAFALPTDVIEAVLRRRGPYAPYLRMAEACEGSDAVAVNSVAREAGLSAHRINRAHLGAIAWAEGLAGTLASSPPAARPADAPAGRKFAYQ